MPDAISLRHGPFGTLQHVVVLNKNTMSPCPETCQFPFETAPEHDADGSETRQPVRTVDSIPDSHRGGYESAAGDEPPSAVRPVVKRAWTIP